MKKLLNAINKLDIDFDTQNEEIAGIPEISFPTKKLAVFIRKKIDKQRDNRIRRKLQRRGWTTTVVWNHEALDAQLHRIIRRLQLTT